MPKKKQGSRSSQARSEAKRRRRLQQDQTSKRSLSEHSKLSVPVSLLTGDDLTGHAEPLRMDEDAIKRLARSIVAKRVFFAQEAEDIKMAFGAILLSEQIRNFNMEKIGAFFEYMTEAGQARRHGRPMFLSVKFVHVDDLPALQAAVNERRRVGL